MREEKVEWTKKNHNIFENYAVDLQEFWKDGKRIESGSQMLDVSMEKQREYMEKNNLQMTYEFVPNGVLSDKSVSKGWKDDIYINTMECRTCAMTRRIYRNRKQIYKNTENVSLYLTITSIRNREVMANKAYNCPNCGALSNIEQLQEMCPYCQTKFKMSDLFPKVTNYYTVKAYDKTDKEVRSKVALFCIPAILICVAWFGYYFNNINVQSEKAIWNWASALLSGTIFGFIIGYALWAFLAVGGLFLAAGKTLPMLFAGSGSQTRFVSLVRRYSPEFSYEFFTNKVVTILRQLLSETQIENNPYYVGTPVDIDAESIVEYSFRGVVALKKCYMNGMNCNAVVDVYMTDFYWKNNRIRKKNDVFRISLTKDLSKIMNYNFSLAAIQCKHCGASFDATRTKLCPYCNNEYMIGDDDWVVTSIRKK